MEFIMITGLSGAGKSVAMKNMEDIGYYCVDNIPPALISVFYELCEKSSDSKMKKVAIVTDIRAGDSFESLFDETDKLSSQQKHYQFQILTKEVLLLLQR